MNQLKYKWIYSKKNKAMYLVDNETGKLVLSVSCQSWKQCLFYQNVMRDCAIGVLFETKEAK